MSEPLRQGTPSPQSKGSGGWLEVFAMIDTLQVKASAQVRRVAWGLMFLAACGPIGDRRAEPSTLTVLLPGDERSIWNDTPRFLLFLPLVARNEKGELEGRLARSWEHSPDYRSWTVHLRSDVRWHDGVPVTAHDVGFTLELHRRTVLQGSRVYSTAVLDDSTYTITYHRRGPGQPPGRLDGLPPETSPRGARSGEVRQLGLLETAGGERPLSLRPSGAEHGNGVRGEPRLLPRAPSNRSGGRQRDGIYRELAAILREDLPITFLFPRVDVVIAQRRLRGLREPWRVDPAWHMGDLWIEED